MSGGDPVTAAEKLAALTDSLKGPALFTLLQIQGRPVPEALALRLAELRAVVTDLASHLPADHPTRNGALARLKDVERLLHDPLEWHVVSRAHELRQDPYDPQVRATIESAFFEEHVPRAVWLHTPADGAHAELRKSLRLPQLVEVDLEANGTTTRLRADNPSRDGLCLDVPAGFDDKNVKLVLRLAGAERELHVAGQVVWRRGGRAGVSLSMPPADQAVIDGALQAHFQALRGVVDRWLALKPDLPAAIACSCLVGYFANVLPSNRLPFVDKLVAATQAEPRSHELLLALAKIKLEERDLAAAEAAVRRAETSARNDPRLQLLVETLAQRRGSPTKLDLLAVQAKRAGGGLRTGAAAVLGVGFVAALSWAVLHMRSPVEEINVPVGGLPCSRMELLGTSATCFLEPGRYQALSPAERARLARITLQGLTARRVAVLTVASLAGDDVIDVFDELVLAALEQEAARPR